MDSDEEQRRFIARRSRLRGTAKIALDSLRFPEDPEEGFCDPKNIKRLIQIFKLEGCLRLSPEHHIPALIDNDTLIQSLEQFEIPAENLFSAPTPPELSLPPGTTLTCLHGRHRIAAAHKFLLAGDRWWTVDLYIDEMDESVMQDMRQEYSNSRNFCDGDIFRQIRRCQQQSDDAGAGRWAARLSQSKRKDLRQLQQRQQLQRFAAALDKLLPYVGFWPSLQIGTFHRILNLRCPEELRQYLNHIRDYWNKIIDGDESLIPLIDFGSIQLLQMRNLWASRTDRDFVINCMETKMIFPLVTDAARRSRILENLQERDCIIPSLYTFFEDTKWLEPCAQVLRKLLPNGCRRTIREGLLSDFDQSSNGRKLRIEMSNRTIQEDRGSTERERVECGYRQLWMFAWRHFPDLSTILPRRDAGRRKPQAIAANQYCWHQLAKLADALGFRSEIITRLCQNPDVEMTVAFLNRVRPFEFRSMIEQRQTEATQAICNILNQIQNETFNAPDTSGYESEVNINHRCGRPYEQVWKFARSQFYYIEIYSVRERNNCAFNVNRDIFQAFFGRQRGFETGQDTYDPEAPDTSNDWGSQRHAADGRRRPLNYRGAGSATLPKSLDNTWIGESQYLRTQADNQQSHTLMITNGDNSTTQPIEPMVDQSIAGATLPSTSERFQMNTRPAHQVNSPVSPALEPVSLFDRSRACPDGCVFVVSVKDARSFILNRAQMDPKHLGKLLQSFNSRASLAVGLPNGNETTFKYIQPQQVSYFVKSQSCDGIIYAYDPNKIKDFETRDVLSTETRLEKIENRANTRKRKRWEQTQSSSLKMRREHHDDDGSNK
ncbi:hypothetical protein ACLMJK_007666 [Lecanora helva]